MMDRQTALNLLAHEAVTKWEGRYKNGKLQIYNPPAGDGGGKREVAGCTERYWPKECAELCALIEAGRHEEAEAKAEAFYLHYTDLILASWGLRDLNIPVECMIRDFIYHRGPMFSAKGIQYACGVKTDSVIGTITRGAISEKQKVPLDFLLSLKCAREWCERRLVGRDESSQFWTGLVNRWANCHSFCLQILRKIKA